MRKILTVSLLATLLAPIGCRSAYINATVRNETGGAIRLVEVDYPSASFGKETMAAGAEFNYRFKILGNGATKVTWTDADRKEHTVAGPALTEGTAGRLTIQLEPQTALWTLKADGR